MLVGKSARLDPSGTIYEGWKSWLEELDTGSTHARPPAKAGGGGYRRRPAGEYRRPLPFGPFLEEHFERKFQKIHS